jgi:hypothetical protein
MRQIPLTDLTIAAGHAVEWTVRAPARRSDAVHKHASYNQQKHFSAALLARAENAPEKNWVATTFQLDGDIDVDALERALYHFVRRHEVLRCAFEGTGEDLRCQVIAPADVVLDRVRIGGFDSPEAVRAYLGNRFNTTINTLGWPLFLMGAVVGAGSTTVYLAFDHIVCDGMSLVMAVNDIQLGYAAQVADRDAALPAVGSYLDFGDLQRGRYAGMTADGPELAYWRRFIAGNGDFFPRIPLDFGVDYGRVHPATNETTTLLDDAQATAFEAACRRDGAKLFQGILAAVGIALREVSGAEVYRGLMPVGERRDPAWRQAFGWFVNTMPIEFPVGPELDFRAVVQGVRRGFDELIANVDVPFTKAWELLAPHYYQLRMWPFPVNFFSFIDFRKLPGAAHRDQWRPTTVPESSHANSGNMWFFRNADGVHLNTIFPDTPEGRGAMTAYRGAIARVLRALADERDPAALVGARPA